jgi:hypothetical protein
MARHSELKLHSVGHHRPLIAVASALHGRDHSPFDTLRKTLALQTAAAAPCSAAHNFTSAQLAAATLPRHTLYRQAQIRQQKLHPGMLSHRVPTAQPNNAMRTLTLSGWTSTASVTGFEPLRTSSLQLSTKPAQQLQL